MYVRTIVKYPVFFFSFIRVSKKRQTLDQQTRTDAVGQACVLKHSSRGVASTRK